MTNTNPILELDRLQIPGDPTPRSGTLSPGGRWEWTVPTPALCEAWADALQGLIEPESGSVTFLGLPPERNRNRVGRIFCGTAFVSNLTIAENIWVTPQFERDPEAIREMERTLAGVLAACGVEQVSAERPAQLREPEKRFWQWIRALSRPRDLFILEDGFRLLPQRYREPLKRLLDDALARGAALITLSNP